MYIIRMTPDRTCGADIMDMAHGLAVAKHFMASDDVTERMQILTEYFPIAPHIFCEIIDDKETLKHILHVPS